MNIQTECKDCCFALHDGESQNGCKLGLIDIFKQRGQISKENNYFVISNTLCPRFRPQEWWEVYKDKYTEQLAFESKIEYTAIIVLDHHSNEDDFDKCASLVIQEPAPIHFRLVNLFSQIAPHYLLEKAHKFFGEKVTLHNILDPDFKIGDGIDFALNYTQTNYVLINKCGTTIDWGFVKYAQQSIYRNFKIIGLLMIDEDNYLIDRRLYKMEKYNLMADIVKKYPEFCEQWQSV
jgi:hypothetical protein